jgi:DNA gyrase subunit B
MVEKTGAPDVETHRSGTRVWETTLDPEIRTLLQVKISHADSAEGTFSTLMGDLVEPHRDFIQANALNVANLDV